MNLVGWTANLPARMQPSKSRSFLFAQRRFLYELAWRQTKLCHDFVDLTPMVWFGSPFGFKKS